MPFDISRIIGAVSAFDGLSSPSKYEATFFAAWARETGEAMRFFCEATSLPGASVATSNVKRLGYGPVTEVPLTTVYDPVSLQMMMDNQGKVVEYFTRWQQRVVNHNYEPGGAVAGRAGGALPFQVSYVESYSARVELVTFAQDGRPSVKVTLHEAWPKAVGSVGLAWTDRDSLARLPVQLAYESWTSDKMYENS